MLHPPLEISPSPGPAEPGSPALRPSSHPAGPRSPAHSSDPHTCSRPLFCPQGRASPLPACLFLGHPLKPGFQRIFLKLQGDHAHQAFSTPLLLRVLFTHHLVYSTERPLYTCLPAPLCTPGVGLARAASACPEPGARLAQSMWQTRVCCAEQKALSTVPNSAFTPTRSQTIPGF